ncbi:hypothetical protein OSCT_1931 [Oscillochloris trichoides DG-6]|uniref:Uncharacterized protein n=1 Tax=Oscillochloris trichoides DG-6 TaxID=765420 RepID=E1IF30_9CHLR|nr:hypothetical protein [Oscillochloris trichoides]EFO80197.1 hypothetical protein OSCT_1931 [Oscillochloris trichoides DG-6]
MQPLSDLPPDGGVSQREYALLRHELNEAHVQNRSLRRQLEKALSAVAEAQRAHAKMVQTLSETMRENMLLTNDRDMWQHRAQRLAAGLTADPEYAPQLNLTGLAGQISEDEINAIRKAMARLHHPDVGGNPDRMKAWNSTLDRLMH